MNQIAANNDMGARLEKYLSIASRSEDLKSMERVLNRALANLLEIKSILIEKEREFCLQDSKLKEVTSKESLRQRCTGLIDHLVHYKCVVECLCGDLTTMESSLVSDDEYIHLSLIFREAEMAIMQTIRLNQKRSEILFNIHDDETQSYLASLEHKWRAEHQERRRLITKLLLDQRHFIVEKTTNNLEEQQTLLDERYLSMRSLIKMSYNPNSGEKLLGE